MVKLPVLLLSLWFAAIVALLLYGFTDTYLEKSALEEKLEVIEAQNRKLLCLSKRGTATQCPEDVRQEPQLDLTRRRKQEQYLYSVLDSYVEYHNRVTSGQASPKYAKCSLGHGYGNCWQQFVSCLLYGIVSKRAMFLVRRNWDKENSFMNNFNKLFLPPPIRMFPDDPEALDVPMFGPKNESQWQQYSWLEHSTMCANLEEEFGNVPYVALSGVQGYDYFADHIRDNPHHNLLHQLPRNFYQIIFDYFLKLRPEIKAQVDQFKRDYFGKYTIGVQLRKMRTATDSGGIHPDIPLSLFLQAAELLSADTLVAPHDVVFFVASTDRDQVIAAQKVYGTKKIVYYDGEQSRAVGEGQLVGFLTMWLLGECDDVITSESSSYGTNAAARTGIMPVVCTHARFCFRRISAQPCSYNPFPAHDQTCGNASAGQFYSVASVESHCGFFFRYLKDCVEYGCPNNFDSFPFRKIPDWPPKPCPVCNGSSTSAAASSPI